MDDAKFLARPSKSQYEWQDMELGMFIHWFPLVNLPTEDHFANFPGIKSSDHTSHGYEGHRAELVAGFWDFERQKEAASYMDCPDFDPDQWVQSAVELGAKYLVFVAKHCSGICRWQSEYGGLNFKYSPYKNGKGDPLREVAEACRKRGIKLGIYLNARDIPHDTADRGITHDPERQEEYNQIYRGWLTEVLSNYGEIMEVWFDGSNNIEVSDILKQYAPNAVVFNSRFGNIRWAGNEEGFTTDPTWNACSHLDIATGTSTQAQGDPDGDVWAPYECDTTLRDQWGYNNVPENRLRPLDELMDMYYNSVGHGANLLINHAPNNAGRIDEIDMQRMKEFGDEIRRRFSNPIAVTSGEGEIVELDLGKKQLVDHVISMEELSGGHRVRSYMIEGFDGENWIHLADGVSLGHKKIDFFQAVELEKVRIRVTIHVGTPLIRSLAAFYVGKTPKLFEKSKFETYKVSEYGCGLIDRNTWIATFEINLTPYITKAGQYKIRFVDDRSDAIDYKKLPIETIQLFWGGVPADDYLKKGDNDNEYVIFAGGGAEDCRVRVTTKQGYKDIKGSVLLERIL